MKITPLYETTALSVFEQMLLDELRGMRIEIRELNSRVDYLTGVKIIIPTPTSKLKQGRKPIRKPTVAEQSTSNKEHILKGRKK